MTNYRYIGRTSREVFVIRGINVFAEKWVRTGKCVAVVNPLNGRDLTASVYVSGGVEFAGVKDVQGYWLFFVEANG